MRAYIIDSKRVLRTFVMAIASAIAIAFVFLYDINGMILSNMRSYVCNSENIIESFPILGRENEKRAGAGINKLLSFVVNEDLDNPERVAISALPAFYAVREKLSETYFDVYESNGIYTPELFKSKKDAVEPTETEENTYRALETHTDSILKNGNELEKKGITVKNQTGYTLNLGKLYSEPLGIKYNEGDIQVLILHTHGSESYNPEDRSQDINKNVVRVGEEMTRVFEKNGIGVIHSSVMHDIPRYNSSYKKSLETINAELSKHGGINIILDVHRDAMITENGDSYKTVCELDGKTAAQVMFVVGTDQSGLKHDNWRENLKLAMKFQEAINKRCPNLARPINLRAERFNQQTTTGTLIIEVGTNGNTLDEAVRAGVASAEAMAEVIKGLK